MDSVLLLFICIIIILLSIFFLYEKDHIFYHIKALLNPSTNHSGIPTQPHIRKKVLSLLKTLPEMNYTLIDFGCGDGDFIHIVKDQVNTIVGIELDASQAEKTRQRFADTPSITIKSMDMVDYKFESIPTIFYMYEPLWLLSKKDADPIYHKVMKNISTVTSPCYIIYVTSVYPILDESFFNQYQFEMLHHSLAKRIVGLYENHIYLFKKL
jgi:16S rRNA A1518/A1519 N6-dimethyltransferase RsmA/KsgA/DIM1 with predicted DNA glycosylase/AP lyase activity